MTESTWQPWADNVTLQSKGNAVFHAAIFGFDGALWGRTSKDDRCPTVKEGVALANVLSNEEKRDLALQNGVFYCNCKFNVISADQGELKAVKGARDHCPAELLVIKRCKMCFILAIGNGEKRGDVVDSLFKTANTLTDAGY